MHNSSRPNELTIFRFYADPAVLNLDIRNKFDHQHCFSSPPGADGLGFEASIVITWLPSVQAVCWM